MDLLTIGQLLGHKSFSTTMVYLHVRRPHLNSTPRRLAAGASTSQLDSQRHASAQRPAKLQQQASLNVASLLRQYAAAYVAGRRRQAVLQVQSTLAKLSLCRTKALGGHWYYCPRCNNQSKVYNSCGDRHCPQCSGAKRADWLTSTAQLLLPGIDYFQVVFTIPQQLSSLALGNRREMYTLLFHSAWRALREVIEEEQGFEASAVMVLHTWNQKLEPHAHVHALVPGGGPALTADRRWVRSCCRKVRRYSGKHKQKPHLVEVEDLRERFCQYFLAGLKRLHRQGTLKLNDEFSHLRDTSNFEAWLEPLEQLKWGTFIEPPPNDKATPRACAEVPGQIHDRRPHLGSTADLS